MPWGQSWTRRQLLFRGAAAGMAWSWPSRAAPTPSVFPVRFRKPNPYESLRPLIEPGHDEFTIEKEAAEIAARWQRALVARSVQLADGFRGTSPVSGNDHAFQKGFEEWIARLGEIRSARFFPLAGDRLRYEISSIAG